MNEMLGAAGEYSKGLTALFNLQEQEGVPTVAPEIVPTLDLFGRPELWALHGGSLIIGRSGVIGAGGAGTNAQVQIEPAQGELVIIEDVWLVHGVAASIAFAVSVNSLAASTANLVARDSRRVINTGGIGSYATAMHLRGDVAVAGTASTIMDFNTTVAGPSIGPIPLDLVLISPWKFRVYNTTQNAAFGGLNIRMRIRQATPRELSIGSL